MPVKLSRPSDSSHEARIEIVPLIDIMFFLLASFMLVSLSMVHALTVKVNLPTAATAKPDAMKDVVTVSIDKTGRTYLDKLPVADNELRRKLTAAKAVKPSLRVVVNGDADARHGDVIRVLDVVRAAGVDRIAFDVRPGGEHR